MAQKCPQCKKEIPENNQVCNFCGFNYGEFSKKESANSVKTRLKFQKAQITIVSFLIVLGFILYFISPYLQGNTFAPIILIVIVAVLVLLTVYLYKVSKKQKKK